MNMKKIENIQNLDDVYFDFDIIRYGGVSARKILNSCVIVKKELIWNEKKKYTIEM